MPISKPALSIGSFATVGFGSIAVAAWHVNANYTAHDFLTDKNYSQKIIIPNMDPDSYDSNASLNYGGSYQCFSHFFPNVLKIVHQFGSKDVDDSAQQHLNIGGPKNNGSQKPMGCALMQLYYKYPQSGKGFKNFVFKSEVTVKNEKVGLALWAIDQYTYNTEGVSHAINYFLLFLENDDSVWQIKGGYQWKDSTIAKDSSYLYIASPDGPWLDATKESPLPNKSFEKRYSGLWEVDESGTGEIFREIMIGSNKTTPSEILGRTDSDFVKSTTTKPYGYEKLSYNYNENKWMSYYVTTNSSYVSHDATDNINKWYKPFRGLTGRWRSFERYCNEESSVRGISEEDPRIASLLEWCYIKKPNK